MPQPHPTTLEELKRKQKVRPRTGTFFFRRNGNRLAWVGRIVVGLAVLVLGGEGGYGFWRFLHSDFFHLKKLVITGVTSDVDAGIRALARVEPNKGVNLLFLPSAQLRDAVLKHPRIESVQVVKYLPNFLLIRATERQPVALVVSDQSGVFHLIDQQGYVLDMISRIGSDQTRFPFVSGVDSTQIVLGQRIPGKSVCRAVDLYDCLREAKSPAASLASEVRIESDDGLTLILLGGVEVRLGTTEFKECLPPLELFLKQYPNPGMFDYIDLRFPDQIIYRRRATQGTVQAPASVRAWPTSQINRGL